MAKACSLPVSPHAARRAGRGLHGCGCERRQGRTHEGSATDPNGQQKQPGEPPLVGATGDRHRTRARLPHRCYQFCEYCSYSTSDNIAASGAATNNDTPESTSALGALPEAPPAPQDVLPLVMARPTACLAASHQLLWYWSARAWHCPTCGTSHQPEQSTWNLCHRGNTP